MSQLESSACARTGFKFGQEVVRWGILGVGDVCEVKAGPGFYKVPNSQLSAVMRRDGAKAADFASRHGAAKSYDSVEALLNDPDVDAVYVASPVGCHLEHALAVCRAGKPCLLEKPMARCAEEAQLIVDAFSAAKLPLWVAYYRRAHPAAVALRALLQSPAARPPVEEEEEGETRADETELEVNEVKEEVAHGESPRPPKASLLGAVRWVSYDLAFEVPDEVASYVQQQNFAAPAAVELPWRFVAEASGGGLVMDVGSHVIDLLEFLWGPLVVTGSSCSRSAAYGGAATTATAATTTPAATAATTTPAATATATNKGLPPPEQQQQQQQQQAGEGGTAGGNAAAVPCEDYVTMNFECLASTAGALSPVQGRCVFDFAQPKGRGSKEVLRVVGTKLTVEFCPLASDGLRLTATDPLVLAAAVTAAESSVRGLLAEELAEEGEEEGAWRGATATFSTTSSLTSSTTSATGFQATAVLPEGPSSSSGGGLGSSPSSPTPFYSAWVPLPPPRHVHQNLIHSIVRELLNSRVGHGDECRGDDEAAEGGVPVEGGEAGKEGPGRASGKGLRWCPSTGESGIAASKHLDTCLKSFYGGTRGIGFWE